MDITALSPDVLRELIALAEKKQSLLDQIAKIDKTIDGLSTGSGLPAKRNAKPAKSAPAPRRKRGNLKGAIVALLTEAGASGISVPAIAAKLKTKPQNVHAWFQNTGKKLPGVSKVGRGVYALSPTT